jgi:hypothetical protein
VNNALSGAPDKDSNASLRGGRKSPTCSWRGSCLVAHRTIRCHAEKGNHLIRSSGDRWQLGIQWHTGVSGGVPDCPVSPQTWMFFSFLVQKAPALLALGAIKEALMRLYYYTKHFKSILQLRDSATMSFSDSREIWAHFSFCSCTLLFACVHLRWVSMLVTCFCFLHEIKTRQHEWIDLLFTPWLRGEGRKNE